MAIRRPLQFGVDDTGLYEYTFPAKVQSFRDNFGDVQTVSSRVIGASGSIDEYGRGVHITANGNVSMTYWIEATDQDEMELIRDKIKGLVAFGTQPLIFQHDAEYRWCWAYLNAPDITINSAQAPANKQRVTLNFRVDNPTWYSINSAQWTTGTPVLWSGTANSGTAVHGSTQKYRGTVEDGATAQVINNGNAYVPAIIEWTVAGGTAVGGTVSDPRVYYNDRSGLTVDDLSYAGTIVGGEGIWIDARDYSVKRGDIDNLTWSRGAWMNVPPGTVDLLVELGAGTAILTVDFYDRWT